MRSVLSVDQHRYRLTCVVLTTEGEASRAKSVECPARGFWRAFNSASSARKRERDIYIERERERKLKEWVKRSKALGFTTNSPRVLNCHPLVYNA